jgi:hypothetical protein
MREKRDHEISLRFSSRYHTYDLSFLESEELTYDKKSLSRCQNAIFLILFEIFSW